MQILFFCPRWGSEHIDWNLFCQQVKQAGYDGVEAAFAFDDNRGLICEALQQNNLLLIGQYYQSF